jgi:hypothetical protein
LKTKLIEYIHQCNVRVAWPKVTIEVEIDVEEEEEED